MSNLSETIISSKCFIIIITHFCNRYLNYKYKLTFWPENTDDPRRNCEIRGRTLFAPRNRACQISNVRSTYQKIPRNLCAESQNVWAVSHIRERGGTPLALGSRSAWPAPHPRRGSRQPLPARPDSSRASLSHHPPCDGAGCPQQEAQDRLPPAPAHTASEAGHEVCGGHRDSRPPDLLWLRPPRITLLRSSRAGRCRESLLPTRSGHHAI